MREGLKRHWAVLKDAWARETEARKTRRSYEEYDFLPAALEILEKPASPMGRGIIWALCAFFMIALIWAIVGKIDVVAIATGRTVPQGNVKMIQAAELGVVRAIHVENGQAVRAGDVLIELDPTAAGADQDRLTREEIVNRANAARGAALMAWLDGGELAYEAPEGVPGDIRRSQEILMASQVSEHEAALQALRKQLAERQADLSVIRKELAKLQETLPLLKEQVDARRTLVEKGLSSRLLFLELQERYVAHRQDVEIAKDQLAKAEAAIATTEQQIEQLRQEFRKTVVQEFVDFTERANAAEQELTKARVRRGLQELRAPVDGIIAQKAVHTIGGVVQPAEPLMVVVPGTPDGLFELQVEALVLNKDVGFVAEGQDVELKLEAFPFTKYGVIHGTVQNIARDAVQDEQQGLIYPAKISMAATTIWVQGEEVRLGPGMSVQAEIKTGKRRIVEFVLAPLFRIADESLRER